MQRPVDPIRVANSNCGGATNPAVSTIQALDVSAAEGLSPRTFQMMVSFGGVVSTGRSIAEIGFELLATASGELGASLR